MPRDGLTLLVGTTKGVFLIDGGAGRAGWAISGPHCDGWPINHAVGDAGSGTIWAGGGGDWFGAGVWRSEDGGATWHLARLSKGQMDDWAREDPDFAQMIGWRDEPLPFTDAITQVWSLDHRHGALHAGTKPARLLRSLDGGETWTEVTGLRAHPSADSWNPGAAGLVLHSIAADPAVPERLWIGISAAGVFATEDGGESWERRNRLSNAEAHRHHDHPAAPQGGEIGHCVHNLRRAPAAEELLYQQNHHGVWRSADGGRSWEDITEGLPSTFGFPLQVHPRDPATVWTLPLNGDMAGRFPPMPPPPSGAPATAGGAGSRCATGLPQRDCYFTVLRQAMAGDGRDPAGVYFGTNSGSVFASLDEGEQDWDRDRPPPAHHPLGRGAGPRLLSG
jgi:hypothetical protein